MSTCVLLLCWADFSAEPALESAPAPALVACSLHRQLCGRFARVIAHAWVPPGEADAFRRWGMSVHQGHPSLSAGRDLLESCPPEARVVLVMARERAAELLSALGDREGEVWAPQAGPALDGVPVQLLDAVLHLRTAAEVGLFVDLQHLSRGDTAIITGVEALLEGAALVGPVVTARMYGLPDHPFGAEFSGAVPGIAELLDGADHSFSEADDQLCPDLIRRLDDPRAPRTWIVVSDGEWLPELIERAHARSIRVLLWSDGSRETRVAADADANLSTVLRLRAEESAAVTGRILPSLWRAPARAATSAPLPVPGISLIPGDVAAAALALDGVRPPVLSLTPVVAGARLNPWLRLLYHVECVLRGSQVQRISLRRLAAALADLEEFGPTPANAITWLNRARAEGMLLAEHETQRADASLRVSACRPNPDHPLARAAVDVPDRCVRLLRQMLQKMPWVSFKLLRGVLLRDQWLGGAPYHLDETGVDEWLNFLVRDNAMRMTKEPNLENPEYPVTALRLNPEHPLTAAVMSEAADGKRLAAERAILAVDHFLIRHRKPWMAMSALRRALESMGRDEMQAVLQGLQNLGALLTESYPNPQKEHFTTGCRLKRDEQIVVTTLSTRNMFIRLAHQHQLTRDWVPLELLGQELCSGQDRGLTPADRIGWVQLLRDEALLELDHDALHGSWSGIHCRVNPTDPVVQAAISAVPSDRSAAVVNG